MCTLVLALGERAPDLDQVLNRAASKTRSEEGFLDVGHELREELVRACRLDDEDLFRGVLLPLLWRGSDFTPGGCGRNGPLVGLGSPDRTQRRWCRSLGVPRSRVPGPGVPPGIPERERLGPV
jgi:hypothetical protein